MVNRRDFLTGSAAAAGLSSLPIGAAFGQGSVKTSFAPTTVDITTGHAAHSSIPTAMGFWKDEGLDVNVFGVAGDTAGIQLLAGGKLDFMTTTGPGLMFARAKGVPLKAIYMHARKPIQRFVVPKATGITKAVELKGKPLGMPVIQPETYGDGVIKDAGLDYKEFKIVATGTGAPALVALRRGDVVGWMAWDTVVAELENRGMEFTEFRPSYFSKLFGNVVVTREEVIRDNPKLCVQMCRAIAKAVHFGLTNPEAAIRIHWKLYPQSKPQGADEAKLMADSKRIFMSRFEGYALDGVKQYGLNFPDQWDTTATLLKEQNKLPADFNPQPAFTNELINQINDWDRSAIEALAKNWKPT